MLTVRLVALYHDGKQAPKDAHVLPPEEHPCPSLKKLKALRDDWVKRIHATGIHSVIFVMFKHEDEDEYEVYGMWKIGHTKH